MELTLELRNQSNNLKKNIKILNDILDYLEEYNVLTEEIADDYAKFKYHMPDAEYNSAFINSNSTTTILNEAMERLKTVTSLTNSVQDELNKAIETNNRTRDELNKNKLKYGLQGQLRSMIDKSKLPKNLPEGIRDVINAPNTEMPVPAPTPNGGKRRKTRKVRKRSK